MARRSGRWFSSLSTLTAGVVGLALFGTGVPAASAAPDIGVLAGAGERPGATRLSFTAGDA